MGANPLLEQLDAWPLVLLDRNREQTFELAEIFLPNREQCERFAVMLETMVKATTRTRYLNVVGIFPPGEKSVWYELRVKYNFTQRDGIHSCIRTIAAIRNLAKEQGR